jgi:predicted nucleic acid-binding protein
VIYIADTNVVSEPIKPSPDQFAMQWLDENNDEYYVSSVTIGELRRGIERMPDGARRKNLEEWFVELCAGLKGRVLSYNSSIAHIWGQHAAKWETSGIRLPILDGLIAATAIRHKLIVVTRNVADFNRAGIRTLNPFEPADRNGF